MLQLDEKTFYNQILKRKTNTIKKKRKRNIEVKQNPPVLLQNIVPFTT